MPVTVIDYFEGSGAGYGITLVAVCCFPLGKSFSFPYLFSDLCLFTDWPGPFLLSPHPTALYHPTTCWFSGLAPLHSLSQAQRATEAPLKAMSKGFSFPLTSLFWFPSVSLIVAGVVAQLRNRERKMLLKKGKESLKKQTASDGVPGEKPEDQEERNGVRA